MASTAFDFPDAEPAARPPLSTHPAFPAVVALWFAALLGLGSLVLPAALFDGAFAAIGLTALVPLGFVARLAIALAAAGGGALAGLAIARRVATGHAREATRDQAEPVRETPRRPLSVHDEVEEAEEAPVMRRRARSLLAAEVAFQSPSPADEAGAADVAPPAAEEESLPAENETLAPGAYEPAFAEPEAIATLDPLPFAPPPRTDAAAPVAIAASASRVTDAPEPFRGDWTRAAPDTLGLVQLVERLGASLERRRQRLAQAAQATPAPEPIASRPAAPAPFDAAPADEAAQAMAAYFGRSFAPPAEHEDDEADPILAAFSLPPARPVALEPFVPEDAGLDEDEVGEDGSFGSLLAMRGPFAAKEGDPAAAEEPFEEEPFEAAPAVPRAFDPPVAAPEPQRLETEAQLREALAALQRMRGAA